MNEDWKSSDPELEEEKKKELLTGLCVVSELREK